MNHYKVAAAVLAIAAPLAAEAASIHTDRTAFEAATSSFVIEGFENANLASGSANAFNGTLNSATNNGIFATGSVLDGFTMSVTDGAIYVENDYSITGKGVSSDDYDADIVITFTQAVSAFAIDLFGFFNVGTYEISVTGGLGNYGTSVVTPGFFGITATDDTFTSVFLNKPDTGGVIDNLTFGTTATPAVPVPASLPLLAGALMAIGAFRRRKAG